MESVVLAFIKDEVAQKIKRMLDSSGIYVNGICHSKAELMRYIEAFESGLIIMGFKLPDATADDVYNDLPTGFSLMLIATAAQREMVIGDFFILGLPTNSVELASSVNILLKGDAARTAKKEKKKEEKKLIEQAKLVLMERHMMTEDQAHRFIQKRSMDAGVKMVDTARLILS